MKRLVIAWLRALPAAALRMDEGRAKDLVALENARCSSWFLIMREVANRAYPPGLDRNMAMAQQQSLSELAFQRSAEATSREVALERARTALQEMMERMQRQLDNLPMIADDYAFTCKALVDDPQARLQHWREQK